ncbi:hypothetical protein [Paenibacillus sp.]|uniref:hypothetical protein n=1 Tax=Paenibacillus sp. TaxID=58172 RepID=UPI002D33C60E|nr:hypothetical protein [Paenibacillus sp.]HZG55732.1 hypothetical protein [Paenibacillus sp.]
MPDNAVHDIGFNANEWFVLGMVAVGAAAVWLAPKRFTAMQALFTLMYGIVLGLMFDHTIAVPPFDLYDVGDQAKYQGFDIFSYVMYAPYGYFFIYGYYWLRVRGFGVILYVAAWTAAGAFIEWIGVLVGVFHYKNGYWLLYSVPIYAYLQCLHLLLFRAVFARAPRADRPCRET